MILKGNNRGGAMALARHLANDRENDHVDVHEVRGVASETLTEALHEIHATNQNRSRKSFYHLSLNPPHDAVPTVADFYAAIGHVEKGLGLEGQPRVVVFHEKQGRRHCHVAFSAVDQSTGKMRRFSWDRYRLKKISAELFKKFGWELPNGLVRTGGTDKKPEWGKANPTNFGPDEWMISKRSGITPADHKRLIKNAYEGSDNVKSFARALEHQGYFLAAGRRGYVAVDLDGNPHSITRAIGVKKKELEQRFGDPHKPADETQQVKTVEQTQDEIKLRRSAAIERKAEAVKLQQAERIKPYRRELRELREKQRAQRKLNKGWEHQERTALEIRLADRHRKGVLGIVDRLTGRHRKTAEQNKQEREAFDAAAAARTHAMIQSQITERRQLQITLGGITRQHKNELDEFRRDAAGLMSIDRGTKRDAAADHLDETRARDREQDREREARRQERKQSPRIHRGRGLSRKPGNDNGPGGDEPV